MCSKRAMHFRVVVYFETNLKSKRTHTGTIPEKHFKNVSLWLNNSSPKRKRMPNSCKIFNFLILMQIIRRNLII